MTKFELRTILDSITKRDFLTRLEVETLLEKTQNFYYMYDFCSCLSEWKKTKKGFTAKDGVDTTIQFNNRVNRSMEFYKDGFLAE